MSKSDNPDEILHRFLDLANQADRKGIVLFSNFLNMYEINLLHQNENLFLYRVLIIWKLSGSRASDGNIPA